MNFLFWQPTDLTKFPFSSYLFAPPSIYFFNYLIWVAIISFGFFLFRKNPRKALLFFLLLLFGEILESILKKFSPWPRPLPPNFSLPSLIIKANYQGGSFPSGHALKSGLLLSFLYQESVSKPIFLTLAFFLLFSLFFRVIIGFHYPIDIFGGFIFGLFLGSLKRPLEKKLK